MPRIRNWKDLIIYRPSSDAKYENIDSLFGEAIDWDLIQTHWKDMIQVALSIQEGKISSSMLLRKLGAYSKKNKLYKAFQELGRVRRSIFLLNYISNPELPKIITATSNKVESFNAFTDLLRFGSYGVLRSNDPVEQEKMIKYNSLIANAVILQNVVDMTNVINELIESGIKITPESLAGLSPYLTSKLKRFGEYDIDLTVVPPPLHELLNLLISNN
jgi:TnpA family transposase